MKSAPPFRWNSYPATEAELCLLEANLSSASNRAYHTNKRLLFATTSLFLTSSISPSRSGTPQIAKQNLGARTLKVISSFRALRERRGGLTAYNPPARVPLRPVRTTL